VHLAERHGRAEIGAAVLILEVSAVPADLRPENSELLAAIIAHPDEDTPRLMYADWLQEHGDPDRAAFIRLHIEWDRRPPYAPPDDNLKRRLIAVWEEAGLTKTGIYERGFDSVGSFSSLEEFCARVPRESRLHPIRVLYTDQYDPLENDPDWKNRFLATLPALKGVTDLGAIDWRRLLGEFGEEYLRLPQAADLRVIDLGMASSAHNCQLLADATHISKLLVLDMNDGCETSPSCLELIAGTPHLRSLVALRLGCFESQTDAFIGEDELRVLLESPYLTNLRQLGFNNHDTFDDATLNLLLRWKHIEQLEVLEFASTGIGGDGLRALGRCRALSGLRRLIIGGENTDPASFTALIESPCLNELKELHIFVVGDDFPAELQERLVRRFGQVTFNEIPSDPVPVCVEDRIRSRYRLRDYFRDSVGPQAHPEYAIL
jgi:uncharacterized protein (TIGR02996 family)